MVEEPPSSWQEGLRSVSTHFNIQISIQRVERDDPSRHAGRGRDSAIDGRRVIDVLSLKVTADSEEEAYDKAAKMLEASRPAPYVVPVGRTDDGTYRPA